MGLKKNLNSAIMLFLLACTVCAQNLSSSVYNVRDYGVIPDGQTDSTQVFQQTWDKVCMEEGNPNFLIPEGAYLIGPLIFKGPCKGQVFVQIKSKLLASTDLSIYTSNWIQFENINGLTVSGGGMLDGQGASAWPQDMCPKSSKCNNLPMSMVFAFVENAMISNLHLVDSKAFHMNVFSSTNIQLDGLQISAPGDSPNTDGIHMGDVTNLNITNTVIGTGDDCISIGPGSVSVKVSNVQCGPGHGISIGSLGKYENEKNVQDLTIKNCTLTGTQNGVRLKTWQDNPTPLEASYIAFEDIVMNNVYNPIIIDQKYCPNNFCSTTTPSKVKIDHVTFKNIRGTSATPEAIKLVCSDALPCQEVELSEINLENSNGGGMINSTCINVQGTSDGSSNTSSCILNSSGRR